MRMGAGAVTGHSQGTAGVRQNQEDQFRSSGAKFSTNIHRTSQTTSPTSRNNINKHSLATDTSIIKPTLQMKMSCDRCSVNFSLFKRKKFCQECHRFFCSTCLPKPISSSTVGRQCSKCRLLVSGHFCRDDLQTWKVNDMKCFLNVRNISTKDCREKHDLIELVLARFCMQSRQSLQDQKEHETLVQQMAANLRDVNFVNVSSSTGTSNENSPLSQKSSQTRLFPQTQPNASEVTTDSLASTSSVASTAQPPDSLSSLPAQPQADSSNAGPSGVSSETTASQVQEEPAGIHSGLNNDNLRDLLESMERIQAFISQHDVQGQEEPTEQPIRRTQLDDITEISHIDALSVRQLKELLVNNFVDYKGCCEKAELVHRTKRLWKDHQENKLRAQRIHNQEETAYTNKTSESRDTASDVIIQEESVAMSTTATSPEVGTAEEEEKTHVSSTGTDTATEPGTSSSKTAEPATEEGTPISKTTEPAAEAATTGIKTAEPSTAASREFNEQRSDSLCYICMDSLIDCILLECGHMVTCTQCGKRLADCPICRQYIVRVVRVFRS